MIILQKLKIDKTLCITTECKKRNKLTIYGTNASEKEVEEKEKKILK